MGNDGTTPSMLSGLNKIFETMSLDGSEGDWAIPIIILWSLIAFSILFCAVKGKFGFVLLAVLIPTIGLPLSIIGAIRLAKPRSWWARHMYDRRVMSEAIDRHEPRIDLGHYPAPKTRREHSQEIQEPSV